MVRIPTSFIQEVLAKSDIVVLIKSRLPLIKRGDNYTARCPFHEEKTPSFSVSQSKQFYYCFGCGAHGNAIGFLMAYDRSTFPEAVKALAQPLGIDIPTEENVEELRRRESFYQCLEQAAKFYQFALKKSSTAIQYLKSRGLTGEIAKIFEIGFASGQNVLLEHFKNANQLKTYLEPTGLIIKKNAQDQYDRFRDRIMFPIRNAQGKVIGFGGRSLGVAKPKYLNSPETPIFHKGHELFGLYEARQHHNILSHWLVVEGYMDVVALHQYGYHATVATLGTAVTSAQIQKLLHYSQKIVFCFDGDQAGRQAAWKALQIVLKILQGGMHFAFLILPEGEDPDSFVRKIGIQAFTQKIEEATPLPEYFFQVLQVQIPIKTAAQRAHFGQEATKYLELMPAGIFRELMFAQLAKLLNLQVQSLPQPENTLAKSNAARARPRARKLLSPLSLAISLLLNQPQLIEFVTELDWLPDHLPEKKLFLQLVDCLQKNPALTTGELLSLVEEEEDRQRLAQLAMRKPAISNEGIRAEFIGALEALKQGVAKHSIQEHISRAKNQGLSQEEKQHLQQMLAKIKGGGNS